MKWIRSRTSRALLAALIASWTLHTAARAGEKVNPLKLKDGSAKLTDSLASTDAKDKARVQSFCKIYLIELEEAHVYRIDMMSPDKKIDPYLRLEDASGKELANDDDSGEGRNARIIFAAPKKGAYRIIATTFSGDTGAFDLAVNQVHKLAKLTLQKGVAKATDALNENDGRDTSRPKNFCKMYLITLKGGQTYQIDMIRTDQEKDKLFDPFLRLVDSGGKEVAFDDDGGGFPNARIRYAVPKDGPYTIVATTVAGTGAYELAVKQFAAAKSLTLAFKGGEASAAAELTNDDLKDNVRKTSPAKVYTVMLKKGKTYQIDMVSTRLDSFLRLEDASGKQLAEDDDSGSDRNARIVFNCMEDTNYRIIATTFVGGTGPFTLTVKEK